MPAKAQPATDALHDWQLPAEFQRKHSEKFPSLASLQWTMRQYRQDLLDAGALSFIGGRLHLHVKRFPLAVAEAGQRVLSERSKRKAPAPA